MATYKELIEVVIRREMGILGRERMAGILADLGMEVDAEGKLPPPGRSLADLDRLMQMLSEKYGVIAVMGCKIAVGRMAREHGLELPPILR